MKTTEEFIKTLVTIDPITGSDQYGHYPFQLFVETADEKYEMNALALGGDVAAVYRRVKHYQDLKAKKIFLSVDFPAGVDIKHDFVAVFSIIDGDVKLLAIPYDVNTGETYDIIHDSPVFDLLMKDFKTVTA